MSLAGAAAALALGSAQAAPVASAPPPAAPSAHAVQAAEPPDKPPTDPLGDPAKGLTISAAYISAELRRGPLDGLWQVSDADNLPLYNLQLSDPGAAIPPFPEDVQAEPIEGAWRDLRRDGRSRSAGVLLSAVRQADRLTLRFQPQDPGAILQLVLRPARDGGWIGRIEDGGPGQAVFMFRIGN